MEFDSIMFEKLQCDSWRIFSQTSKKILSTEFLKEANITQTHKLL